VVNRDINLELPIYHRHIMVTDSVDRFVWSTLYCTLAV